MLSIYTEEKLKNWALFAAIGVIALVAVPVSGMGLLFVGHVAALFLVPPLLILFKHIGITKWHELSDPSGEILQYLRENSKIPLISLLMLGIILSMSTIAYVQTANLLYSAFIFFLPFVLLKISNLVNRHAEVLKLLFKYSTSRPLNLKNKDEAEFNKTLNELCQNLNSPIPKVTYLEVFDKVKTENFAQFRKELSYCIPIPKNILDEMSDSELLVGVQELILPNIFATKSFLDGNHITINSAIFKHDIKISRQEIEAVLAHELGHHASADGYRGIISHGLYFITAILGLSSLRLAGLALIAVSHVLCNKFNKSVETNADLYAANKVGADGLISFFNKTKTYRKKMQSENAVEDEPPTIFEKAKGYYHKWAETHPSNKKRIETLSTFMQEKTTSAASVPKLV